MISRPNSQGRHIAVIRIVKTAIGIVIAPVAIEVSDRLPARRPAA